MSAQLSEILVTSIIDGTKQPSLFYCPETETPVPLVVGFHPWSHTRIYPVAVTRYLALAEQYGWALLLPEFRGCNCRTNPNVRQACGSAIARQDIFDAIDFVCSRWKIDTFNVFALGCSGGGMMALLVAEDHPEVFHAVDTWCPVSDLARWYDYVKSIDSRYWQEIEACLGGAPIDCPEETAARSPITNYKKLANTIVSIHHGRHDPVVPYKHSLDLVNRLNTIMSDTLFYEVFDGGHESIEAHSFEWFARLSKLMTNTVAIGH